MNILVLDDERPARENLIYLLKAENLGEIREAENVAQAISIINQKKPDLLFCDIQLPGLNGMDFMLGFEPEKAPLTIFVTAHRHYAHQAFEVNAIDYLVKPFRRERFRQALEKVRKLREAERVMIRDGSRLLMLELEHTFSISSSGNYALIQSQEGELLVRKTLDQLEAELGSNFIRIHRQHLVPVGKIRCLKPHEKRWVVELKNGVMLPVSRKRLTEVKSYLIRVRNLDPNVR